MADVECWHPQVIDDEIRAAYRVDLSALLRENRVHFFELKAHLEHVRRTYPLPREGAVARTLEAMRCVRHSTNTRDTRACHSIRSSPSPPRQSLQVPA